MAKILVVDDDPDFVEATRLVLESAGYEVHQRRRRRRGPAPGARASSPTW